MPRPAIDRGAKRPAIRRTWRSRTSRQTWPASSPTCCAPECAPETWSDFTFYVKSDQVSFREGEMHEAAAAEQVAAEQLVVPVVEDVVDVDARAPVSGQRDAGDDLGVRVGRHQAAVNAGGP